MKRLLSLIICAVILLSALPFGATAEMAPNLLPEIIIGSTIPVEIVEKGDLYEVFGVLCEYVNVHPKYDFNDYIVCIRLPAGADSQEDVDNAIQFLLTNPNVMYAEQNSIETGEPEIYKVGDINNDGEINAIDYTLLKRAVIGTCKLTEIQQAVADINGDGRIRGVDYLFLKRAVMGNYIIEHPYIQIDF